MWYNLPMIKIIIATLLLVSSISFAEPPFEVGTVYRGVGPTDESAAGLGEVELFVMNESTVKVRYATGLKIEEWTIDLNDLVELSKEEKNGAPYPIFKSKTSDAKFIFSHPISLRGIINRLNRVHALIYFTGGMGDILSPILLYNSSQVRAGRHDQLINSLEKTFGKNTVPRIAYEGKVPYKICSQLFETYQ
jgi:hypothetical protein